MCYSAQIQSDYRKYVRAFGAQVSIREFFNLFWRRRTEPGIKVPKAMEAAFDHPLAEPEREIKTLIDEAHQAREMQLQQELFKQKARLANAQRKLATKPTKSAAESARIATAKIEWVKSQVSDLHRTDLLPRDSRLFPGWYAPVLVVIHGQRTVIPMRYQCRPAGKPASYDTRYPGTYNARRDNLEGFWSEQFGHTHGVVVASAFFENVPRHKTEQRELAPGEAAENVVLEFAAASGQEMLVACLWSRWTAPGEPDLWSFAAITDEPPAEVAATGHDRCIIPIKPQHLDAWLNPDPAALDAQRAILDDRERLHFAHRMAA